MREIERGHPREHDGPGQGERAEGRRLHAPPGHPTRAGGLAHEGRRVVAGDHHEVGHQQQADGGGGRVRRQHEDHAGHGQPGLGRALHPGGCVGEPGRQAQQQRRQGPPHDGHPHARPTRGRRWQETCGCGWPARRAALPHGRAQRPARRAHPRGSPVSTMLNVTVKSHRPYLRADAGLQKLFVMLKMAPSAEAATARPRLDLALVLDTSGSMRERAPGLEAPPEESPPAGLVDKLLHLVRPGSSKLDVATEAARRLLQSPHLQPDETVSVIQFDDSSTVLATGRAGADRAQLLEAVNRLQQFSGGTQMALGLQNAQRELSDAADATRTVFLLTDGKAVDEDACRRAADELAQTHARIVALGVGEEYNEDLLADLCSVTGGRPYDFRDMSLLPKIVEDEVGSAVRQVVDDVQVTVKTVRDVKLVSAARVYPSVAGLDPKQLQ